MMRHLILNFHALLEGLDSVLKWINLSLRIFQLRFEKFYLIFQIRKLNIQRKQLSQLLLRQGNAITASQVFPVEAIEPSLPFHQETRAPQEIRLLGQCILNSMELRVGDRLYLYVDLESTPLVAELKLADSFIPFLPAK